MFCEEHGIALLVVFGSVLDEDVADPHDLDVALLVDSDVDLVAVVSALTGMLRFDDVDVMDLRRAGVVARDQALSRGLPLYEREAGLFARDQLAAMTQRMETAWLRELDMELLAEGR